MTIVAVLLGGIVGTGMRLALHVLIPPPPNGIPFDTLLVNIVGSFALAVLVARVWPVAPAWLRAGLGAGVLGSFTTFSAVALAVVESMVSTASSMTLSYVLASSIVALGAAVSGLRLARPSIPNEDDE